MTRACKDFVTGLILTPKCKLVVKVSLPARVPENIHFPCVVQAAVGSYKLARSRGDIYLSLQGLSVCLSPGNGFLALVLTAGEDRRFESAFKARQISNWFNLLHGEDLEAGLAEYEDAGSLEEKWDHPSPHDFDQLLLELLKADDFLSYWLEETKKVSGLVVGALIDHSLSDQPVFEVPGSAQGWLQDPKLIRKIWLAALDQCKVLSLERAARRSNRRRSRKGKITSEFKHDFGSKKQCCLRMRFGVVDHNVCVYIKLIRLPEHDPCLVLICNEAEDHVLGEKDTIELMLSGDLNPLEAQGLGNGEAEFPLCVRLALQDARTKMKTSFPKSVSNIGNRPNLECIAIDTIMKNTKDRKTVPKPPAAQEESNYASSIGADLIFKKSGTSASLIHDLVPVAEQEELGLGNMSSELIDSLINDMFSANQLK